MDNKELIDRLDKLGITISIRTLTNLANRGIISPYEKVKQKKEKRRPGRPPKPGSKEAKKREAEEKRKPGRYNEWKERTLQEVAAVYAVCDTGAAKLGTISVERVAEIKKTARRLFESPKIFFESPSEFTIVTPPKFIFDTQALELTVKDNGLNNLAVTWIAAREKVRQYKEKAQENRKISDRVKVIVDWYYNPPYKPPTFYSKLIPELPQTTKIANQLNEMTRRVDEFIDGRIGQLEDEERERIRTERDAKRFTRGKPRLEPLRSNRDELVVFLHSHQEFMETQAARNS